MAIWDLDGTIARTHKLNGDPSRIDFLDLIDGIEEIFKEFAYPRMKHVLLTQGIRFDQERKIEWLGIREWFQEIHICEPPFEKKGPCLQKVIENSQLPPDLILVVGDCVGNEIRLGNLHSCTTIRMRHEGGTHSDERPIAEWEMPDFTVKDGVELRQLPIFH